MPLTGAKPATLKEVDDLVQLGLPPDPNTGNRLDYARAICDRFHPQGIAPSVAALSHITGEPGPVIKNDYHCVFESQLTRDLRNYLQTNNFQKPASMTNSRYGAILRIWSEAHWPGGAIPFSDLAKLISEPVHNITATASMLQRGNPNLAARLARQPAREALTTAVATGLNQQQLALHDDIHNMANPIGPMVHQKTRPAPYAVPPRIPAQPQVPIQAPPAGPQYNPYFTFHPPSGQSPPYQQNTTQPALQPPSWGQFPYQPTLPQAAFQAPPAGPQYDPYFASHPPSGLPLPYQQNTAQPALQPPSWGQFSYQPAPPPAATGGPPQPFGNMFAPDPGNAFPGQSGVSPLVQFGGAPGQPDFILHNNTPATLFFRPKPPPAVLSPPQIVAIQTQNVSHDPAQTFGAGLDPRPYSPFWDIPTSSPSALSPPNPDRKAIAKTAARHGDSNTDYWQKFAGRGKAAETKSRDELPTTTAARPPKRHVLPG